VLADPRRKRREKRVRKPDEVEVWRAGLGRVRGEREPRRASCTTWLAEGMVGSAGLHVRRRGRSSKRFVATSL
jgi:hypothetical protein